MFCDDFYMQLIIKYIFLISNNRMNLSADQYLNMIDQMTMLRLSNQRNQRDKAILAEQVQKQKQKLKQLTSINTIVPTTNAEYGNRPDFDKYNRDVKKISKTADDYIEDFKNSITSMQNKICQFIATNGSEQMKQIKNQILKMKEDIKPITRDLPKEKENKQNPFLINLKQAKQRTDSKRLNKTQLENKENKIPENKTIPKEMQKEKQKEVEEFYKKVKFIYGLWNKDKKQPSLQELYVWVNKINAQSSSVPLNNDFNPIQAAKRARSQKKLITFNNINQSLEKKEKSHQKSSKRLHQRDLDSQNQYQKQTQNYFNKYIQPNKNRQINKQNEKRNDKNSNETTKKSDKADEQEQFQPMPPKIKDPRKSKENIPSKLHKVSKLHQKQNKKNKDEKNPKNNESQAKDRGNKTNSKNNIKSNSKIENQIKNQRNSNKGNKGNKGSKSSDPNAKKNGSKTDLNRENKGSIAKIPPKNDNSRQNVSPKPTIKDEKPRTNKKNDDKPISNSKGTIPQKKNKNDKTPKNKNDQSKPKIPRRESIVKK